MSAELYRPEYCEKTIEFLGKARSIVALSDHLDVAECTIYEWRKRYPEFDLAIKRGQAKGQAWLEEQGIESLWKAKDFNNGVYMFTMKSQYKVSDGSDAREHTHRFEDGSNKVKEFADKVTQEHPI
jgi:hypothetical protein